jgi:hypothetical protein
LGRGFLVHLLSHRFAVSSTTQGVAQRAGVAIHPVTKKVPAATAE